MAKTENEIAKLHSAIDVPVVVAAVVGLVISGLGIFAIAVGFEPFFQSGSLVGKILGAVLLFLLLIVSLTIIVRKYEQRLNALRRQKRREAERRLDAITEKRRA